MILTKKEYLKAGDAVFSIMEQLYNAENAIDADRLRSDFNDLCDVLSVNDEMLDFGLNVKHVKHDKK